MKLTTKNKVLKRLAFICHSRLSAIQNRNLMYFQLKARIKILEIKRFGEKVSFTSRRPVIKIISHEAASHFREIQELQGKKLLYHKA